MASSGEIVNLARRGLVLTLFLIGSIMTRELLQSVGFKPMVYGVCLWGAIALVSLGIVLHSF